MKQLSDFARYWKYADLLKEEAELHESHARKLRKSSETIKLELSQFKSIILKELKEDESIR